MRDGCRKSIRHQERTISCALVWRTLIVSLHKKLRNMEDYMFGEGGNDFDNLPVEKQEKIKEGMQLFIDYFRDLWI